MAIMSDNKIHMNNLSETDNFQLPVDVIIHILSYLSMSDRMSARLVNRTWHEASLATEFIDQEKLVLGRPRADNLNKVLEVLQHSTRPFYHFTFREVELKSNMPIWDQYGPHMRSLVLLCCDLSEKTLVEIFKYCKSLKVLHINACRECLMSGRLLEDENDIKELVQTFKHVQELSLGYNRFLSDALFNRLVAICPNLESLSLMGCQISFHCGLYKKFYPRGITLSDASNSVLTFLNILQYLKQQAARLKHLNFGYTLMDGTALATLSAMEDLRLESLMLQVSPTKNHITEETMRKENMRILSANVVYLHEESIESISKSFPNLRQLELSLCYHGVTNKTIQMIFKELVHLQILKISHCVEVSDAGLTGMGLRNHEYVEKEQVVQKPEFTESRLRISLRSKAEEEIVRDADRKREVMHLCENVSEPLSTFSGFSLIRLKCLQELDLSVCGITDVSLKHAFAFLELRILNLSQCQQITHIGLDYLSKNNPAIEYLNLNYCYNISDVGISYLAQRLHRLKRLLIQGCSQLTDRTLDFIKLYCKSLHYLDSRYCRGMTLAGRQSMTHLNVDWSKNVVDMVSPENEVHPPPPPPLPSLPSLP
ncbi:unnamed protein product [Xylocopa violacea]|uniref:F-box domain-containing protein n=1 Tax=Xylocopa violacea TaxID=135666 RepID=A0ABP1NPZ1_XYLVO